MNSKWFEEVDGKPSRFRNLLEAPASDYWKDILTHAFRALLAEDAAAGGSSHRHEGPLEMFSDCINELNDRIATLERKVKRLRRLGRGRQYTRLDIIVRMVLLVFMLQEKIAPF